VLDSSFNHQGQDHMFHLPKKKNINLFIQLKQKILTSFSVTVIENVE
jgi:hypothetical protein